MKYFGIDSKNGYPSRFVCEDCADCEEVRNLCIYQHADTVSTVPDETMTTCDECGAALADANTETTEGQLEMAACYTAAPIARFAMVTKAELAAIAAEINDPVCDRTATTEGARAGLDSDRRCLAKAIDAQADGARVWHAQDEDGHYFATQYN